MHADEALLKDEAIEDDGNDDLMPSGGGDKVNDKQKRDEEIDETMPYGGDDVTNDEQKVETRADDGKALGEQIVSSLDEKPAPSDKSFKHFEKMEKEFERQDANVKDFKSSRSKLWPFGTVPYEFDDVIMARYQDKIHSAMKKWEEKTCVKFKPYSHQLAKELRHNQRIRLVTNGKGCKSHVGMKPYRKDWDTAPQKVNLTVTAEKTCMTRKHILHELGHTLGLYHEMARHDRDEYLNVYPENMVAHKVKKRMDKHGVMASPYDYLSIMHYEKSANAKKDVNGYKITFQPKEKCYEDVIGETMHLSYYDHKAINTIYGCTKGCEYTSCRKNCYSTRFGENGKCHCVCLDNYIDPCKGGSYCLLTGDKWPDWCSDEVSKYPSLTCTKYAKECCKSCEGVKTGKGGVIGPECPQGRHKDEWPEWCPKNNTPINCFMYGTECCKSCKGV